MFIKLSYNKGKLNQRAVETHLQRLYSSSRAHSRCAFPPLDRTPRVTSRCQYAAQCGGGTVTAGKM